VVVDSTSVSSPDGPLQEANSATEMRSRTKENELRRFIG
jgi:hypothetical protein